MSKDHKHVKFFSQMLPHYKDFKKIWEHQGKEKAQELTQDNQLHDFCASICEPKLIGQLARRT